MTTEYLNPTINANLPDLPEIRNKKLYIRALTHSSWNGTSKRRSPSDIEPENNERLVYLGSRILHFLVLWKLYHTRPCYDTGDLDELLQSFVKMNNVADWADWYSLPDKMRCHEPSRLSLVSNPSKKAQLFLAYLSAVYEEDRECGENWIWRLMECRTMVERTEVSGTPCATPTHYHRDLNSFVSTGEEFRVLSDESAEGSTVSGEESEELSEIDDAITLVQDSAPTRTLNPVDERSSIPNGAGRVYFNGVSGLAKLNELVDQDKLEAVKWSYENNGPEHNKQWAAKATVKGHPFTSDWHRTKKEAQMEVATRALLELHLA